MALPELGPLLVTSGLNMARVQDRRPRQLWGLRNLRNVSWNVKNCGFLLTLSFVSLMISFSSECGILAILP